MVQASSLIQVREIIVLVYQISYFAALSTCAMRRIRTRSPSSALALTLHLQSFEIVKGQSLTL